MKTKPSFFLSLILVCSYALLSAQQQPYHLLAPAYTHLYEVNQEWAKHQDVHSQESVQFLSENDRIRFHLQEVIAYLKTHRSQKLSDQALAQRLYLLEQLSHYADQKVFPKNIYHQQRRPYFIDHQGTHCAVGYLMAESGHSSLAQQIKEEHNYDYIRDIKTEGVLAWANTHGFSLQELALIQPGYPAASIFSAIDEGANGPITSLQADEIHDQLLIAGQFDSLGLMPCLNVGVYKDDQLSCLGQGVEGIVNNIHLDFESEKILVTGSLLKNGNSYPLAIWNGTHWSFYNIPNRDGANASSSYTNYGYYSQEIAISHPSIPNQQEIWFYSNTLGWVKKATISGSISDIQGTLSGRVYVGNFNHVTVHRTIGDTSFYAHNVVRRSLTIDNWFSMASEGHVSNQIQTVKVLGAAIYFGGYCSSSSNEAGGNICLSRYLNGTFQPLLLSNAIGAGSSGSTVINNIELEEDELILGGSFSRNIVFEPSINNVAKYDLIFNALSPLDYVNGTVNSVVYWKNDIFVGGHFNSCLSGDAAHLARSHFPTSTSTINGQHSLKLYPNPASDLIYIDGLDSHFEYSILNLEGKVVQKGTSTTSSIQLDHLEPAVYIVQLLADASTYRIKFVKQ